MKRALLLLVVILIGVVALGYFMGWFHVASHDADGKSTLTLTVDKDKIQKDKDKALATVQDLGHQAREKAVATTQKAQDETATHAPAPER